MQELTKILIGEGKYDGHVITKKLPINVDNALYTLIHFIGGLTTREVIDFANRATEEDFKELYRLLIDFPKTIQDIMPLAGSYKVLKDSKEYQKIVNLIKMEEGFEEVIEEGKNLNKLVWKGSPLKKHQKRMDKDWGVFSSFPIKKFMNTKPPKNNSDESMDELQLLDSLPVIKNFVKTTDDVHKHFINFLKTKKLEYPKKEIKDLLNHTSPIILKLKYHYNRPRPEQLAKEMGLKFHSDPLDSARTPSYPSGHAAQGRFISRYLSDMYPKHENELMKLGNEIGTGRLVAKVHYPSDDLFGKEIGDALYKTMGKKVVKEEAIPLPGADGFYTTDTNPYFTNYISPKVKQRLFKHWDSLGEADYDSLKLFGVEETSSFGVDAGEFHNVGDVLYPVLALEWLGGVENTKFAKQGWETTSEMGFENLKFKLEPISFDYMFDESESFGESGYACWDIRVLIDKDGDLGLPVNPKFINNYGDYTPYIQDLFPESAQNKLSPYHNYTNEQMELIEGLWEYYHNEASKYSGQFCKVEVRLV
tara:strand:- start:8541 stop:10142 length:1602 start_codon:yes stop_codon:yes gene_type:complete